MENCIFCKIANKEIPAEIIWEDENFIAGLDINPFTEGMALIIPKKHYPSNLTKVPLEVLTGIVVAGQKVSRILERALGCERVILVFEGLEVNHLHLKLFPSYKENLFSILNKKPINTEGDMLSKLADKIRKS